MIPGLSGSLLSHEALSAGAGLRLVQHESESAPAHRRLRAWHATVARDMGPAFGARSVFDRVAAPLGAALGFRVTLSGTESGRLFHAVLEAHGAPAAALLVTDWGREPASAWRDAVRHGIARSLRWCFCLNGPTLRVLDARRTYSRRFAEFDLETALHDPVGFTVFWGLLRADAFPAGRSPRLEGAVAISEQHRAEVRASLQLGVHEALICLVRAFAGARTRRRDAPGALFEESLVVIYRILFLLFAEARGLVPKWHPIYRASYTIEALRTPVEVLARPHGLWESLQAIARLAHRGCRAGTLRVPPFNGRLFSPVHAPLAESAALDDGAVREALLALTTRAGRGGRQRIAYADLGVEQLGGVYERILDFEAAGGEGGNSATLTLVRAGRRKTTGAFYTPRALTEYLVRRTLAPLVRDAPPERILSLRVLDPAMGSGAFLVAACRYLALAYEAALIHDGVVSAEDVSDPDRSGFRRAIAQRCLFGVDINPMAVQLARLSLWLATLAGDRPLTFLDHHLRAGNSLVGASLADLARQPRTARARRADLPLLEIDAAEAALGVTIGRRLSIANDPGDTIEQVRTKERLMASLIQDGAPLARWKAAADLWCAAWFEDGPVRLHGATFGAVRDEVLGRGAVLPPHVSAPLLDAARRAVERERFFHWTLEFPEVFHDAEGRQLPGSGFDAVLGNPPWEMLRADGGPGHTAAARLTAFTRASGVYSLQSDGHANLYQLFLERVLSLVRTGGRMGIVLPSGFASDHGCAALRRRLLDRTQVDTFISIENRDGLFPIHRGLKFLLIAATPGQATITIPCRFGVRSPDVLDELPDLGGDPSSVLIPRSLVDQLTGEQLAIPELRTATDVAIASRIAFSIPALGDPAGWHAAFGRELNATEDKKHFVDGSPRAAGDLPVIEGKLIRPFVADVAASRVHIPARTAAKLLDPARTYSRPRLAYRDVAAATNRLTLIAAIVPAGVVTTHTLFCLKKRAPVGSHLRAAEIDDDEQTFLCGIFNSFVANYLVRLRVGTHVTTSIIGRLPVPRPARDSAVCRRIAALSARLSAEPDDHAAAAQLQARVAQLYGLDAAELEHVLGTFPLVDAGERARTMDAYVGLQSQVSGLWSGVPSRTENE
jgi:hypothetical protein